VFAEEIEPRFLDARIVFGRLHEIHERGDGAVEPLAERRIGHASIRSKGLVGLSQGNRSGNTRAPKCFSGTRSTHGFIWDLVERWMPEVLHQADLLGSRQAEEIIRERLRRLGVGDDSPFYPRVLRWAQDH
jgi:hypothetical protein